MGFCVWGRKVFTQTKRSDLPAREVALKYEQLWMVEDVFRSMKSLLDTRPIFHKCDETTRGHVFCSFLALLLRKELEDRLARKEWKLEWADMIRDLDNLILWRETNSVSEAHGRAASGPPFSSVPDGSAGHGSTNSLESRRLTPRICTSKSG